VLVAALALVVFFGWLGARDVTTSHEARVAQTARVMAASGWPWAADRVEAAALGVKADREGTFAVARYDVPPLRVNPWLIPVLNGEVRLQKPPLPNWCVATLYRLFGVSEFATRLMPALFAAIGALLVADLARRVIGRAAGLIAALVWVSTLSVVAEFRETTPDPFLAFLTLVAVWAWVRASRTGPRSAAFLMVAYVSLGLGTLAKGPFVFVHVGIAVAAYAYCFRRRPRAGVTAHVLGVLLMLAIAVPWPWYALTHVEHAAALWGKETTRGGETGAKDIVLRSWEYLPRLLEFILPWTPLWLLGIVASLKRGPRRRRRLFPLLWAGVTVAAFSLSPEKKNAYLLPVMPALTLLVTIGVLALAAALRRGQRGWSGLVLAAQLVLGVGVAVLGLVTLGGWGGRADLVIGAAVALPAFVLLVVAARRARVARGPSGVRRWLLPQAAGTALACALTGAFAHAVRDNVRSAKPFARNASELVRPPASLDVPRLQAEASFYLPLEVRYDPAAQIVYDIVEPGPSKKLLMNEYRPPLPHGRVVDAEIVQVAGQALHGHWQLIRMTVEPLPTSQPQSASTSPASPATPSSARR
jgi:4-amino-4-deoxy-L-arabinose transferase-like glycosyltransferase